MERIDMKTGLTQKERSAATRRKLLDAAAGVLINEGYANLTTTKVCKTAGVSQGALFKHYESKMVLLAALATDLYAGLAQEFETLFSAMAPDADVIHESIRHLWTVFSSQRQLATYDMTVAARTDRVLKGILDDIVLGHRERIRMIADQVYQNLDADRQTFDMLADLVLIAVQGMVINGLAYPESDVIEQRLACIETTVKKQLALAGKAGA